MSSYDNLTRDELIALLKLKDNQIVVAKDALSSVDALIKESDGVVGLHLNGDVARWDELLIGGKSERWLFDYEHATLLFNI